MKKTIRLIAMLLGLACFAAALSAAGAPSVAVEIDASLDRETMTTDEAAVLNLEVRADQQVKIDLPRVDGLRFQPRGQSSRMEMVNGAVTTTVSQVILVYADAPGDYTLPRIKAIAGGEEFHSTSELKLRVEQGAGPAATRQPAFPSSAANKVTAGNPGDLAYLEVVPAKTEMVVGELIPLEIRAYFRAGERITLRSHPKIAGGAYTLKNQEGEPRQERVTVGGVPYTRLTFYAGIAAAKPGNLPANVALDATVVVRETGSGRDPMKNLRSRMGSIFDDPFFSDDLFDDFFGRLVEKEVDLVSEPIAFTVSELPLAQRPAGFTGAVGSFTARAVARDSVVETGDPLTVKIAVEGEGNFDRVTVPGLTMPDGWKVYPASSEFVSGDAIGQSGVKLFEQVLVPLSPEISELPAMELVFFNPASGGYEIARTDPVPLEVTGAALPAASVEAAIDDNDSESNREAGKTDPAGDPADLTPLYARSWFTVSQVVAVFVILSGSAVLLIRRWRSNPDRRNRKRRMEVLDEAMAGMDRAIDRDDAPAFFESVRRIVQWRISRTFGLAPAAISASDAPDAATREILDTADAVTYSGRAVPAGELRAWKGRVLELIKSEPIQNR